MSDSTGKSAVVTGGSRGIGRAIVKRLAAEGADVVFSYATAADAAASLVSDLDGTAGRVHAVQADFTAASAVRDLMETAWRLLDGLDILVDNAALSFALTAVSDTSDDNFERGMLANAYAAFSTVRYAAQHMPDNGRIVNISTMNTLLPAPGNMVYAMSKGAIEQLSKVSAVEPGSRGITVNTVLPGATDTELLHRDAPPEALEMLKTLTPLQRLGEPADIADIVTFLASPGSRRLTAQNIAASGGLCPRRFRTVDDRDSHYRQAMSRPSAEGSPWKSPSPHRRGRWVREPYVCCCRPGYAPDCWYATRGVWIPTHAAWRTCAPAT